MVTQLGNFAFDGWALTVDGVELGGGLSVARSLAKFRDIAP
jgi:hypothetical protein